MPVETKPEPLSDVPSVAILQALEDLEKCDALGQWGTGEVTHWCELPEPPAESERA